MRRFSGLEQMVKTAALAVSIGLGCVSVAVAERMAVVIGNSAYTGVPALRNPVNDANRLSEKLRALEFEVLELTDLPTAALWGELDAFLTRADDAEIVLFYFSGHAFQLENVNYLVPVDARLNSVASIGTQTWALNDILKRFESLKTNTVVMLDACRNNPLPPSMQSVAGAGGGLARIESGADTKVVFATQPHAVAYEGTGEISHFTQAVLDHIDTDNQSLDDLIRNVRNQVRTETVRRQIPWSGGNLSEAFYFKRKAEPRDTLTAVDIENLLLNFPSEQLPAILSKLAETVELDLGAVQGRIETAQSQANLAVLIDGDRLDQSAPQDEIAEFSVASGPIPTKRPHMDLAALPRTDGTVTLDDPDTAVPRRLDRVTPPRQERVQAAVVVTRARMPERLLPTKAVRVRLSGTEFWLDENTGTDDLADLLPQLSETTALSALDGRDLSRATQTELDRLGCYRDRIDGLWGRNSRFALTSYYLAKGIVFDDLEPDVGLLQQLRLEPEVICTGVEARAPKRLSRADVVTPVRAKAPAKAKAPRGTISYEAQEEIRKGGTFVGIRVR